jgi:hypothetical protein
VPDPRATYVFLLPVLFYAIPRFILICGIRVLSSFTESAFYPHLRNPRLRNPHSTFYPNPTKLCRQPSTYFYIMIFNSFALSCCMMRPMKWINISSDELNSRKPFTGHTQIYSYFHCSCQSVVHTSVTHIQGKRNSVNTPYITMRRYILDYYDYCGQLPYFICIVNQKLEPLRIRISKFSYLGWFFLLQNLPIYKKATLIWYVVLFTFYLKYVQILNH